MVFNYYLMFYAKNAIKKLYYMIMDILNAISFADGKFIPGYGNRYRITKDGIIFNNITKKFLLKSVTNPTINLTMNGIKTNHKISDLIQVTCEYEKIYFKNTTRIFAIIFVKKVS